MRSRRLATPQELDDPKDSMRELLGDLFTESSSLVKDEIALAEQEIKERAASLKPAITTIVIGVIVGAVALIALSAAAVVGLGESIGYALAALIVGIFLAIVTGVILSAGFVNARQTVRATKSVTETLKEGITNG